MIDPKVEPSGAALGGGDDDDDDPQLESLRGMWRTMRDEDPPERGLAELMAAARVKTEEMAKPSWWQRLGALLRRPPVLALATLLVLIGGAVFIGRHRDKLEAQPEAAAEERVQSAFAASPNADPASEQGPQEQVAVPAAADTGTPPAESPAPAISTDPEPTRPAPSRRRRRSKSTAQVDSTTARDDTAADGNRVPVVAPFAVAGEPVPAGDRTSPPPASPPPARPARRRSEREPATPRLRGAAESGARTETLDRPLDRPPDRPLDRPLTADADAPTAPSPGAAIVRETIAQAKSAAARGDCAGARKQLGRVAKLDAAAYRQALASDAALKKCAR